MFLKNILAYAEKCIRLVRSEKNQIKEELTQAKRKLLSFEKQNQTLTHANSILRLRN